MNDIEWQYQSEISKTAYHDSDVLVLGGGIAGCMAAIDAAKSGMRVTVVEKAGIKRSGAGGSGCDHWENAATNPGSTVSAETLTAAMMDDNDGYNNAISHYIEAREGWHYLSQIETMGGKIRDDEDLYKGAAFRDEKTKLLYAYDYDSKTTLRIWGSTFKPAMVKTMRSLGIEIVEHTMVTSLLTTEEGVTDSQRTKRCIGAMGFQTRTGAFHVFHAKSVIMAMSRPARIWLFSASYPGICEFRPMSCIGDGHAMGWRAGAEFNMMEKSVRAQFSSSGRSFPPYSTGNNHNTWYPASMVDSRGKTIPYMDRDGNVLERVEDRFKPANNQAFFLKGGNIEQAKYAYDGPETMPYEKLNELGYKLPFYADLTDMPEMERDIIWGMMVGEEGKTKIPVLKHHTDAGFDPKRDVLQCYGVGWQSASFLPQERQLFGLPGGFMNDWHLETNIEGLYAAGDALFSSNCYGHAASTGGYAGRHAAEGAKNRTLLKVSPETVEAERARVYAPLYRAYESGMTWKELNHGIAKTMQLHCGEIKEANLLKAGLSMLETYEAEMIPQTVAANPHELMRLHEVYNILTVSQLILEASLSRKKSVPKLEFYRNDSDESAEESFIVIKQEAGKVYCRDVSLNFAGDDLKAAYERFNPSMAAVKGDDDH
ncbi:FAD-dependent oxidoreductase [Fusibacter paucivorans]|uniref:FAD-dependent oxidoreductase n=1 Tax=Fusibacter paucivorans TaxID=76009 RepID=A0ABS5PMU9_9FIRM|nr:FAD-dependent oxidoreductase [Fusibacter paucivorans]MBS7525377.1 FAD-dependent oxidoreductase [Fusibacter paucivorans]